MPYKDKEKAKETRSKPENKARHNAYLKEYNSRPKVIARKKVYSSRPEIKVKKKEDNLKPEVKARIKEITNTLKIKVFSHYSKTISNSDIPICACCGYTDLRLLSMDHIESRQKIHLEDKK